jgi:hypothetical protein
MWYTYTSIIGYILLICRADLGHIQMDQDSFIEKIADKIAGLGVTGPAILLLEAHKPLAFISSQLLLVAQPTLDIFVPQNLTRHTINMLADSDQLEQLITKLETKTKQKPPDDDSRSKIDPMIQHPGDQYLREEGDNPLWAKSLWF